jgi:hypothetical protein
MEKPIVKPQIIFIEERGTIERINIMNSVEVSKINIAHPQLYLPQITIVYLSDGAEITTPLNMRAM